MKKKWKKRKNLNVKAKKEGEKVATIQTSIQLTDRISGALQNIVRSLDATTAAFDRLDDSAQNSIGGDSLNEARRSLEGMGEQYNRLIGLIYDAGNSQRRYNDEVSNGESAVGGLVKNIAAMAAAYFSFQSIVNCIKNAVDYASDLVEVQNVVDVTFGSMADDINKWSQTTSSAFGISELTAKQYSSTLGAMMKSGGLAGETMKNMSINMTQLAADMASFYNLDTDTAFEKIRSGLSGETEPLKALGIDMSVAGLEAYRMAQGIDIAYSSMDNASKMALRYQYLMLQTADAQTDFSRTQDSFANQTRLLGQSWENFTGQLASNALPVLTEGVYILNNIIGVISSIGEVVSNNWSIIEPILMGAIAALIIYNSVAGIAWLTTLQKTAGHLAAAAATAAEYTQIFILIAAQDGLNAAIAACPLSWLLMAIVLIIAAFFALIAVINKLAGTSYSVVGIVCGAFAMLLAFIINNTVIPIQNIFAILVNFIANCFNNPIAAVKAAFYDMADTVLGYIQWMAKGIEDLLNKIPGVTVDITSGLNSFRSGLQARAASVKNEAELKDVVEKWDFIDIAGAGKNGYGFGVNIRDGIVDKLTPGAIDPGEYINTGSYDFRPAAEDIAKNTGNTAGSVSDMAGKLDITNEKLEYLRDIAERDVVNRYTTDSFKFEFTNNNNGERNIDGTVDRFAAELREFLNGSGEGAPAIV